MKATMTNPQGAPLTIEQLQERLSGLDAQIGKKQAERRAIEDTIPRLIAEHRGTDLAAVRERKAMREIAEYLEDMKRTREILQQDLEAARQADRDAQAFRDYEACKAAGKALVVLAERHQRALEEFVASERAIAAADQAFCSTRSLAPCAFDRMAYSRTLWRISEVALYALSEGMASKPKNLIESSYELRQRGSHDVARAAQDYVTVVLREVRLPTQPPTVA
jgi:hypothetical protein